MKSELINMTQTWDKEKILFPDRNQTQDPPPLPRTPGGRSIYWASRTHGEQSHLFNNLVDSDKHPAYC